jgi:hypothetical protein
VALVLMLARKGRVHAWHRRQIRCRRCDGLNTRLLVVGDDSLGFLRDAAAAFFKSLTLR